MSGIRYAALFQSAVVKSRDHLDRERIEAGRISAMHSNEARFRFGVSTVRSATSGSVAERADVPGTDPQNPVEHLRRVPLHPALCADQTTPFGSYGRFLAGRPALRPAAKGVVWCDRSDSWRCGGSAQSEVISALEEDLGLSGTSAAVEKSFPDLPRLPADFGPAAAFGPEDLVVGFGISTRRKVGRRRHLRIGLADLRACRNPRLGEGLRARIPANGSNRH